MHRLTGMGWMVTVVVGITIQSALVKWLGETLSSVQILWLRGAVGLFFVLPIFAFRQVRFYSHGLKRHFLRALAGVLSMACWFYALTELPLAEATSYSFAMPLFLTVLAWAFLGEKLKWQTWLATVMGFSGVLIIMRPDSVTLGLTGAALDIEKTNRRPTMGDPIRRSTSEGHSTKRYQYRGQCWRDCQRRQWLRPQFPDPKASGASGDRCQCGPVRVATAPA